MRISIDIPRIKTEIEVILTSLTKKYSKKTLKNTGIIKIMVVMQIIIYFLRFLKILHTYTLIKNKLTGIIIFGTH
jgi:hypothetical protein